MAALEHVNPSQILIAMSRELVRAVRVQPPAEQFASAFVARIDTLAGRLDYASAGVEGGMLFRCLTSHEHLIATGPLLGMQSRPYYGERSTQFSPGNLLVAYTDGVVEARSTRDATFLGTYGLAKLVHNTLSLSLSPQHGNLIARLDEYAGGVYNDDATLVCVTASEASRS
jgi:serine phosphatase RsbU (regulator of sigma subunit)